MAYDKVIDSSVLDAGLKQIADAIREKGGTTDSLTFPAAMAEAIAGIESGGGNISAEKLAWGVYRPSSKTTQITITHNLGVIPQLVVACRIYIGSDSANKDSILTYYYVSNPDKYGMGPLTVGLWDIVQIDSDMKVINKISVPNARHYEANTSIAILKTAEFTEFDTKYYFWFAVAK